VCVLVLLLFATARPSLHPYSLIFPKADQVNKSFIFLHQSLIFPQKSLIFPLLRRAVRQHNWYDLLATDCSLCQKGLHARKTWLFCGNIGLLCENTRHFFRKYAALVDLVSLQGNQGAWVFNQLLILYVSNNLPKCEYFALNLWVFFSKSVHNCD